ncbi:hypothetical protein [uncultured Alistipes sp.]|uniref:hypothetical protein n=1 Tax=uncultured Alistipes sp. TaxID=538949 RepID=UPI0026001A96|nr:hypothetical protein [uncultured Alistipes sp.]
MATIKERVMQLLEYKKIPKESFFAKIGTVSSNFRGAAAKTPLNSAAINNILTEIPDVNLYWLITGNGRMIIDMGPGDHQSGSHEYTIRGHDAESLGMVSDMAGNYSVNVPTGKGGSEAPEKHPESVGDLWALIRSQQRQLESLQRQLELQAQMIAALTREMKSE